MPALWLNKCAFNCVLCTNADILRYRNDSIILIYGSSVQHAALLSVWYAKNDGINKICDGIHLAYQHDTFGSWLMYRGWYARLNWMANQFLMMDNMWGYNWWTNTRYSRCSGKPAIAEGKGIQTISAATITEMALVLIEGVSNAKDMWMRCDALCAVVILMFMWLFGTQFLLSF